LPIISFFFVATETTGWSAECAQPSSFHAARFCHIVANLVVDFVVFDVEHRGVGLDALKAEFALSRCRRCAAPCPRPASSVI
jgi:hypothetical protein